MRRPLLIPLLGALLLITALVSWSLGRYPLSGGEIMHCLARSLSHDSSVASLHDALVANILMDIRLPRIMAAILIGSALSVSGAVFQSMFINPLVSPGLLGVLAGASFGACVAMIFAQNWFVVQLGAFSCGLLAVFAAVGLSSLHRGDRLLMLILGGIISGALFTALLSGVKYLADPYEQLPAIVYWLMGGLSSVDRATVGAVSAPIIVGLVLILSLANYLNVLSMGDEEARSLGVNVTLLRGVFIVVATVISALTVVMGGIIGWVGLLTPHIARMIVGPDNRILLPASALIGATYLLMADDVARLLFRVEIPIGLLTSLIGIPFFALILARTRGGWN